MRRFGSRRGIWIFGLLWGLAQPVCAQFVVAPMPPGAVGGAGTNRGARFHPESSFTAESLLRAAETHVRDGRYAEAIDLYQRVIREFGDMATQVAKDDPAADPKGVSQLFVDARQNAHRRIAALPPEGRALYRRRLDPEAERWFRAGAAGRDPGALKRVLDEAFCSSFGDDALERLGDLEFRQGHFGAALAAYRRIVPDPAAPGVLVHPDPDVDRARVAAKILLGRAAAGVNPPTAAELEAFARTHPGAQGPLAGRTGPLAGALAAALRDDHLAPPPAADSRWPTFAGAPARTRIAPAAIDVGSLQWKVRLEPVTTARMPGSPMFFAGRPPGTTPQRPDRGLAYYPIVLGDQVILCDSERIFAYNLGDRPAGAASAPAAAAGEAGIEIAWRHELPGTSSGFAPHPAYLNIPHFTLTGVGDRVFARLGPAGGPRQGTSYLVAVDRKADGKLLWRRASSDVGLPRRPGAASGHLAAFEGSPVADARRVYVALTDSGGMAAMTSLYVACLDADTGATRWVRFLGEATVAFDGMMMGMPSADDVGSRLLTLDGETLYYQTNLGAVAALEAETGTIRWLVTYPHAASSRAGEGRVPNPAIVHDGRVLVAPDDSPDLFAFDAATGRLEWRAGLRDGGEIAHLLGVAHGRLIATGNRVWSFDVKTGQLLRYWPEGGTGYQGCGRGLLAGRYIYWPTRGEILVLDQATGLKADDREAIPLQQAFGATGGNLAVGDGYLVVASEDALVVFCQNSRLIHRYREAIAAAPEEAANYVRLARAAESAEQDELALASLTEALKRARPAEMFDGQPLADTARMQQYRLRMRLAARARLATDWPTAARHLEAAAAAARQDRDRLAAQLGLAEALDREGDPAGAVRLLQAVLGEERLPGLTVAADDRRTVRADLLIADRLANLLSAHGRDLYAEYDRRARALLDQGRTEANPRLLDEIARSYPAAAVVPESLLALGQLHARQGRPAEAARAFKRLLAVAPDDPAGARALLGLGHAYEAQGYLVLARDMFARAQARFADLRLDELDTTVGSLATERLSRPAFAGLTGDRLEPALRAPLMRAWSAAWAAPSRPLAAEGVPPAAGAGRIFRATGTVLHPIDPSTGRDGWEADLGGEPTWVGYQADRVLAATATRLVALDVKTGAVRWTFDAGDPRPSRRLNPFAPPPAPAGPKAGPARLEDFRIVGGRIFCRRGTRELIALDGESGQIDWSFAPAGKSTLSPHFWVDPRAVVLQVRDPNAVVALDAESGTRRAEIAQEETAPAWLRDPLPIDDDHVAVVADARGVTLLDLSRGVAAWTYDEPPVLPRNGPPRLLGDSGRLLVLRDGSELVRLDPLTGKKCWSRLLGVEDLCEWPDALAIDDERLYCATVRSLSAYNLGDGTPVWRRYLTGPQAGWSVALSDRFVVAYPSPARSPEDGLTALPVVFCRRDTGQLVQRVQFSAPVTALAVRLAPGGVLLATQDRGWALAPAPVDAAALAR